MFCVAKMLHKSQQKRWTHHPHQNATLEILIIPILNVPLQIMTTTTYIRYHYGQFG
jgi:hypothetical protein